MVWGYLTQFWDAITGATIDAWDFTIEYFQNIGNAVAGAIGALFENLVHHIFDAFYFFYWVFDQLKDLLLILLAPLRWAFNFITGVFDTAFKTLGQLGLEEMAIGEFSPAVFEVFDEIPYFYLIPVGVGGVIGILFLGFIVKKLIHI